jgi:hypothetical protein
MFVRLDEVASRIINANHGIIGNQIDTPFIFARA